jgi:hypothetical protein
MECPLCDASVEGDGGLVELDAAASPEAAAACFAFAAFHLGDAQPVFADAVTFARARWPRASPAAAEGGRKLGAYVIAPSPSRARVIARASRRGRRPRGPWRAAR